MAHYKLWMVKPDSTVFEHVYVEHTTDEVFAVQGLKAVQLFLNEDRSDADSDEILNGQRQEIGAEPVFYASCPNGYLVTTIPT